MFWGAAFSLFSVILGAFGTHDLKEVLTDSKFNSFETGIRYQMYHGLALLILVFHAKKLPKSKLLSTMLITGTLLFSGSIYLLNIQELIGVSLSFLGPITPVGGLFL